MKKDRKRLSVTITEPYIEALSKLVKTGIYLSEGDVIREAMRIIFSIHGIEPFKAIPVSDIARAVMKEG